jgi:hypothetical protein
MLRPRCRAVTPLRGTPATVRDSGSRPGAVFGLYPSLGCICRFATPRRTGPRRQRHFAARNLRPYLWMRPSTRRGTGDRPERTWPLRPGRRSLARHGQAGRDTLGSSWELRCGPANQVRVFCELAPDAREVWVLAIGVKDRDRWSSLAMERPWRFCLLHGGGDQPQPPAAIVTGSGDYRRGSDRRPQDDPRNPVRVRQYLDLLAQVPFPRNPPGSIFPPSPARSPC